MGNPIQLHELPKSHPRRPPGVTLLVAFFLFGASMCTLAIVLLVFPDSPVNAVWRINPEARDAFTQMGHWAFLLMAVVGAACAATAWGLYLGRPWGRLLAIAVLAINLAGDLANVMIRHELRTLIGIPIAGWFIIYLLSRRARWWFER